MSDPKRYIVWRKPFTKEFDLLLARSEEHQPGVARYNQEAGVLLLAEEDLREVFREKFNTEKQQIYIPDDYAFQLEGTDMPAFTAPGRFVLGADVPITLAYAGRRNVQPGVSTYNRSQAEALIEADEIRKFAAGGARKVNVVIVDSGLDSDYVKSLGHTGAPVKFPAPFPSKPNPRRKVPHHHANAVARNVLKLEKNVTLFDAAILPERIDEVDLFTWDAFWPLLTKLLPQVLKTPTESWVVVCAWGLLDRKYDRTTGTFADDRGHPLSIMFEILTFLGVDVVFSAGNNGQFWPDIRSGHTDRGPERSIIGSNGLGNVLTVGAVDAVGDWIGESAQGPEPDGLRRKGVPPQKPDVCAPTWFREDGDPNAVLTGTSGACAMAAGVVACVRRRVSQNDLPPNALISLVRETAQHIGYPGGDARDTPAHYRLGSGIIDCKALKEKLP